MKMKKYALIVRAGSTNGGKYYNDYRDGSILLFNNEFEAEKFATKIEEGSGDEVWVEVVVYDPNRKLPNLLSDEFVEKFGKKMGKIFK
jgi:hypothetical protein